MTQTPDDGSQDPTSSSAEKWSAVATVGAVLAIVAVVVLTNVVGSFGGDTKSPRKDRTPAAASRTNARQLATMAPEQIAGEALKSRPAVVPPPQQVAPSGAKSLANAAEKAAAAQPFDFTITTFNALGSQHTAPGGSAPEYAPGRIRAEWAAELVASYGADVVGFQEIQGDQVSAISRATAGQFEFWPGTALGGKGIPQSLMWRTSVWQPTWKSSLTIPFMGGTRPQPIVRLRHLETGREIYVMNVHNSPKDAQGREGERDKATAIEIAAVRELRKDGIPVFVTGDFNEHEEIFCKMTGGTDLVAANGGSNDGVCRPPRPMRVDWIFGSVDAGFSRFRMDTGPQVRRITDHAVLSSMVAVP